MRDESVVSEDALIREIVRGGVHRFVVSAWNMFELSKARNEPERLAISDIVRGLSPLYLSNNNFIKQRELLNFLNRRGEWPSPVGLIEPFNETVARMWSTYGGAVFIGETFGEYVEHLVRSPDEQAEIQDATDETPLLIKGARKAVAASGLKIDELLINEDWIFAILPGTDADNKVIDIGIRKKAAAFAAVQSDQLFKECPTIHADELRYRFSIHGNRRVDTTHAVDTQHTIAPVDYCDFFLTADQQLKDYISGCSSQGSFPCRPISQLQEIKDLLH